MNVIKAYNCKYVLIDTLATSDLTISDFVVENYTTMKNCLKYQFIDISLYDSNNNLLENRRV